MRRLLGGVVLAVLLAGLVACGDDATTEASIDAERALSGQDIVEATRAAGTARATVTYHQSVADPGTDHGTSGAEETELVFEDEFDFEQNRSVSRWTFDETSVGGLIPDDGFEPMHVEQRSIGRTGYVRDGRFLCPGCPIDDIEIPADQWITVDVDPADKAFGPDGHLQWVTLLDEAVAATGVESIEGEQVTVHETRIPVAEAATLLAPEFDEEPLQGDVVQVRVFADVAGRLRRLEVRYHAEDRDNTWVAELHDVGAPVEIEVPPNEEIYQG